MNFKECLNFYSDVLSPLQINVKWSDANAAGFGRTSEKNVRFLIEKSDKVQNCHIAFSAPDKDAVDSFHSRGIARGCKSNGAAGFRTNYAPNYYAAFLFDPNGNNIEAVE